jgi:Fe-S-cluster-containing dehydrogenase component
MNLTLLRVTQRIAERSKQTRSEYLARIHQAKSDTVHRSQLACGNLAHGFAACQPEDKASLKSMLRNNIAKRWRGAARHLQRRGSPASLACARCYAPPCASAWPAAFPETDTVLIDVHGINNGSFLTVRATPSA